MTFETSKRVGEEIQFESRFIDSTIQQKKFNLGDEREKSEIEVEVEYTTKAKSN